METSNKPYATDGTHLGQPRVSYLEKEHAGHIADEDAYSRSKNLPYRRKIAKQMGLKTAARASRKYNDAQTPKIF